MNQIVYTSCTLDCPDGCGIVAHVQDGRVTKLEGHAQHEFTRGYLCAKTYHYPDRVYSSERQLRPLRRQKLGAIKVQSSRWGNFVSTPRPKWITHVV